MLITKKKYEDLVNYVYELEAEVKTFELIVQELMKELGEKKKPAKKKASTK